MRIQDFVIETNITNTNNNNDNNNLIEMSFDEKSNQNISLSRDKPNSNSIINDSLFSNSKF